MYTPESDIQFLVEEVLRRLASEDIGVKPVSAPGEHAGGKDFIYSTVDEAVDVAAAAQSVFQGMGLEFRRKMIMAMRES